MHIVEANGLVKRFGTVAAVDDLSFGLEKGSITGLIGPNGAGKTTTIRIALGLLRPNAGEILTFGETPWDNPRIRERIGVVYERASFPQYFAVHDYLSRVGEIFACPSSRVDEVLQTVGLTEATDRTIKALSAGMLQKFSIAHALIHEPELVIADEPTANLDPQARSDLLDLILRLNKERGITFFISSHILPELSRVCQLVAIINQGKIRAYGRLQDLYEQFGARVVRILTNKPSELVERIKSLEYVVTAEVRGQDAYVETKAGLEDRLYYDVPRLAAEIGGQVQGIESKSASLEELFRRAVASGG